MPCTKGKSYTTGEMFNLLTAHPALHVKRSRCGNVYKLDDSKVLRNVSTGKLCLPKISDTWTVVDNNVSADEAIKAWAKGKAIKAVGCPGCTNGGHCGSPQKEKVFASTDVAINACKQQINGAKWYILG